MSNLSHLAAAANKAHLACERAANSMLRYARQAGEALIKAKQELPHGKFTSWIEENCKFGSRMARKYMLLANGWDELSKRNHGSVLELDSLSMREALRILSSGGVEELGDFEYVSECCPSCGERLARTSVFYVTCIHCFDCKLYMSLSEAAYRNMQRAVKERERAERELHTAKFVARKFPIAQRADLLLTLGECLDSKKINEWVTALRSDPTERVTKAKAQLRKLVEALQD